MRTRLFWFLTLGLLCGAGLAAQSTELDPIEKQAEVVQRSVVVQVNDPALRGLAQRALSLHGGIELRTAEPADFVLTVTMDGGTTANIAIASRSQTLTTQRFIAASREAALVEALDYALSRLFGAPGWLGSQLVFVSDRTGHKEIYHSDLLFQRPRQLTRDRSDAVLPAIAPDGSQVLYTSYHGSGFPDMFAIDLRTNQRTTFAAFRGLNTGARFSPDGRRVALIMSGSDNAEIFLASPAGGDFRRLTTTRALEADPTWSPDGRRLALTSDAMGRPQIYTLPVTGGAPRRVPTNISRHCAEPAWNPRDANQLAFTAAMAGEFEIALYDFTAGESRVLTRGAGDAIRAQWLADGRHLLYTARTSRTQRLMVLDTQTGKSVQVSPRDFGNASMADVAPPQG